MTNPRFNANFEQMLLQIIHAFNESSVLFCFLGSGITLEHLILTAPESPFQQPILLWQSSAK